MAIGTGAGGVLVVGSIHEDTVLSVPRLPGVGETSVAHASGRYSGGKGANQAAAAALAGARTAMLGRVGNDEAGRRVLAQLIGVSVDVDRVVATDSVTGTAVVAVGPQGDNLILVSPGANHDLTPSDVASLDPEGLFSIVLAQAELTVETLTQVARSARAEGKRFVLNLAPVTSVPDFVISCADPLVVNQTEAAQLLGLGDPSVVDGRDLARAISDRFGCPVVVTLGADGAAVADGQGERLVPSPSVQHVVDTTGAGDAFCGALTAFLQHGSTLTEAVAGGVCAGALAVTRSGAQASFANLAAITDLMASSGSPVPDWAVSRVSGGG